MIMRKYKKQTQNLNKNYSFQNLFVIILIRLEKQILLICFQTVAQSMRKIKQFLN